MSFIENVRRAKVLLQEEGRISVRGLKREFALDDDGVEELVEELVEIQRVAVLEGKALAWAQVTDTSAPAAEAPLPATSEAERRQLTVMFVDLVDSTELSRRLDAEDLRDVMRAYQDSASEVIERYEGHVAQYLGDGLLVYFGWPQAHEDDAERAVRAGLAIANMLAELNPDLEAKHRVSVALRVGIHTGPVVVSEIGEGERKEVLAVGDTTNVAARLQNEAERDTVVLSADTLRLVAGVFATRDLGERDLKGVGAVRVHQAVRPTGVRSRLDLAATLTPVVGRQEEVGLLLGRWDQVQEGQGQAVLVLGEAGVGKSRLARMFRERLSDDAHTWLECCGSPYTRGSPLHPLIELVEQGLMLREGEPEASRLRKLEAGVAGAGLPLEETLPLFAALLGVPLQDRYAALDLRPAVQRQRTLEALLEWMLTLGGLQPVVLMIEDLHWIDPSTLEFLGMLIEQSPSARVMTLLTARPEFEVPWPAHAHSTSVTLARLTQRQARQMTASLAGGRSLPQTTIDSIVARTDGIPLYVEELVKSVLELPLLVEGDADREQAADVSKLVVPATLQDSLMARLDRLPTAKGVAQVASVLGREFSYLLLAEVAELDEATLHEALARLVEAELLVQRGAQPRTKYSFRHALIQDTAYHSLLRTTRQRIHRRTAESLDTLFPERVTALPEVVAQHYEAGGLLGPAVERYQNAGERAIERSAHAEAIGHLSRGIELLQQLPEGKQRTWQELRLQVASVAPLLVGRSAGDTDLEVAYERVNELCAELDGPTEVFNAVSGLTVPIFIIDDEARLVFFNEAAETILGQPYDQFQATERDEWEALLAVTDVAGASISGRERPMINALETGEPTYKRERIRGVDEIDRMIEACAFPLFGDSGDTIAVVGMFWELESISQAGHPGLRIWST